MLPSPVLTDRLAELVADLSGCSASTAEEAVRTASGFERPTDGDERLEVVARALVTVRRARRAGAQASVRSGSSSPTSSTMPPPSASSAEAC